MRERRRTGWKILMYLSLVGSCWLLQATGTAFGQQQAVLDSSDCIKCHDQQPREIAANGASHKTELTCQDCHAGHRPKSANNIPQCSMCHEGEAHFTLQNCLRCHTNPHTPLDVTLAGSLKAECLTCHAPIGDQLKEKPSRHTQFACTFCHAEKHGRIPECTQCHKPHASEMTAANCGGCHANPHQPRVVTYNPKSAPSEFCGGCHQSVYQKLKASQYKHSKLACAICHRKQHKMKPACTECHSSPHPEVMLMQFPNCLSCHSNPHDLQK